MMNKYDHLLWCESCEAPMNECGVIRMSRSTKRLIGKEVIEDYNLADEGRCLIIPKCAKDDNSICEDCWKEMNGIYPDNSELEV